MKLKGLVIFIMSITLLIGSCRMVFAANWVYVGSQTFCTGETRADYLDTDSVMQDEKAGTMVFWVRSDLTGDGGSFQKLSKYETKLDFIQRTRYLEWHVYVEDNLIMEDTKPDSEWLIPEDITLLGKAVEMAGEVLDKQDFWLQGKF